MLLASVLSICIPPLGYTMDPPPPQHTLMTVPKDIWTTILSNFIRTQDLIHMLSINKGLRQILNGMICGSLHCTAGKLPTITEKEIYTLFLNYHPSDIMKMVAPAYAHLPALQNSHIKFPSLKKVVFKICFDVLTDLQQNPLDTQQNIAVQSKFRELLQWKESTCSDGVKPKEEKCSIM